MDMPQVPIYCNLLWPSHQAALSAPKGDIQLAYCPQCGHVFNAQFDLSLMDYTQDYENSLHFSPRFQAYATALAQRLIEDHQLYNKQIVDIGSGKGDFMRMLCELGDNRATGFDPSYAPDEIDPDSPVSFIADYYTEKYTSHPADFISCRHVFEHIPEAAAFAQMVRRAVGNRWETAVFFEVPNVLYTLQDLGIWDIIYEHCSYFSPHSLAYAFAHNGFRVHNLDTTFNGQFLTIEAFASADTPTPLPNSINDLTAMTETINTFADNFHHKVNTWQERLAGITASGHKAVIWGAGSKGVTFLNILQTQEQIRHAVDINPRKEGKFVAGTGQEIVTPDFLKTYQPQYVIIMNGNYREEIGRQLEELGLTAEILLA
jgi:hypothetical protein